MICAGSVDTFQIYVWSVRTGRLLDLLAGHEGPVAGLAFSPSQSLLASASWDKTVRTWDVFRSVCCLHAVFVFTMHVVFKDVVFMHVAPRSEYFVQVSALSQVSTMSCCFYASSFLVSVLSSSQYFISMHVEVKQTLQHSYDVQTPVYMFTSYQDGAWVLTSPCMSVWCVVGRREGV